MSDHESDNVSDEFRLRAIAQRYDKNGQELIKEVESNRKSREVPNTIAIGAFLGAIASKELVPDSMWLTAALGAVSVGAFIVSKYKRNVNKINDYKVDGAARLTYDMHVQAGLPPPKWTKDRIGIMTVSMPDPDAAPDYIPDNLRDLQKVYDPTEPDGFKRPPAIES